jgi:4-hydroxy-3-methylbut-2-enyl diphosphate reductase
MDKRIIISSNSGFCFGVKRALDIAAGALKEEKTVYSLGPIIHNPQVVDEFFRKGLKITKNIGALKPEKASLLIPSHGISPGITKKKSFTFIDTTCPLVGKVQKIVRDLKARGYFIIIVGDRKHPEVRGLVGIAGNGFCAVVKGKNEAKALKLKRKKTALISQTTSSLSNFKEVASEIAKKDFMELVNFNTVCRNTIERQKEAEAIAGKVDAMIVIGGKQSANTSRLAAVCKKANKNTYHIESKNDLRLGLFKNKRKIGIATGASTPPASIREVTEKLKEV